MSGNQNMLETDFPNYGETGVHSTSNSERLATSYPNSPIHSGKATHIEDFTRDGIKTFYAESCLGGEFPDVSEFGESNYDYDAAPAIPGEVDDPVHGEAAPGQKGSTIVASGKGPNVATINLENLSDVDVVDPSTPSQQSSPFLSPRITSEKGKQNTNPLIEYPPKGSSGFA